MGNAPLFIALEDGRATTDETMMTASKTSSTRSFISHSSVAHAAIFICLAMAVSGCNTSKRDTITTGSIAKTSSTPLDNMDAAQLAETERAIGGAYVKDPRNRDIGLRYATVLGMTGKHAQALAVMQQVAIANPSDRQVLAAYGKAQAAAGQLEQALGTIGRAQTPDHPDWRLMSAEGAVLDQLGRSQEARQKYRSALQTQPNEPSIMSNLGMSYVLSGDLKTAETYMRNAAQQPAADSRVRQNLALVVGLQGRFSEAETIARRELSQQQADTNVTYLRSMLSQQNSWAKLADKDKAAKSAVN